ncbi:hypothetical protein ACH5RR_020466 [Cinchona calisaya]|uniref:Gnk2-homologous domain-containing protein n=1 Tax=Cinchona calisaya TaxID=153742 RepID=A0ABD2ZIC7_9GENT
MALFSFILLLFLSSCTAVFGDGTVVYCSDNLTIPTTQMSANVDSLLAEVASATSKFAAINFFGKLDRDVFERLFSIYHPQHPTAFKKVLAALMSKISSEAMVPANNGFAKGKITSIPANVTPYGVAQYTANISLQSCNECLNPTIGNIPKLCNNVKTVSC